MKRLFFILGTFLLSLSTYAAMNVNKIDPPFWYTGMQNPELFRYRRLPRRLTEQHGQTGKPQLPDRLPETGEGRKARKRNPYIYTRQEETRQGV